MSYAIPRPVTVAGTAVSLCNADMKRTAVTFDNVSTENKYLSTRRDVTTSGNTQGKPLYVADTVTLDRQSGSDPTQEWFAIGTVTGGAIIVTEEYSGDMMSRTERLLADIVGTLKTIAAALLKVR